MPPFGLHLHRSPGSYFRYFTTIRIKKLLTDPEDCGKTNHYEFN